MTTQLASTNAAAGDPAERDSNVFVLRAGNVTGSQEIPVEVDRTTTAGAIAESIAHRMALPDDVAWGLRDDSSSAFLDDTRPIGDQVKPGARVTAVPKTHLGAVHSRGGEGAHCRD